MGHCANSTLADAAIRAVIVLVAERHAVAALAELAAVTISVRIAGLITAPHEGEGQQKREGAQQVETRIRHATDPGSGRPSVQVSAAVTGSAKGYCQASTLRIRSAASSAVARSTAIRCTTHLWWCSTASLGLGSTRIRSLTSVTWGRT